MQKIVVDVDYVLRQINKGSEKWIKVPPLENEETYEEALILENNHLQEQKRYLIDVVKHLCETISKLPLEARDPLPKHTSECDCLCHKGVDIMHFEPCCDRGPGESSTVYITERGVEDE